MKKLLCLVLALALVAMSFCVATAEEEKKYDLQGMTVKVRNWDSPNPYAEDCTDVDKEKWLPIYEAAKAKYNCEFEFYEPTVEYDEFTTEWLQSIAAGSPAWHITNNFSAMWLLTMCANGGLEDISKALESLQIPETFKKTVSAGDGVYGFVTGYQGTEGLVYNRAMIEEAGMDMTPGEMFMAGKWSYNEFYDYMVELQSKLPEGTYAFFIDPNYWQIFASAANGTQHVDNELNVTMTSDAYIETMEFLQKLWNAGVCRMPDTTEDGGYDEWSTPSRTFDQGVEVAMTHRAGWQYGGMNNNGVDWGFVPYPWGSNVTCEGDYTTLSDTYRSAFYDYGCMGNILAGVENDFPGIEKEYLLEALTNLCFDLFVDADKQAQLAAEAAGEGAEKELELGSYNYMEDAIIYDFLKSRTVYNNSSTIGGFIRVDYLDDPDIQNASFSKTVEYAVYKNLSMRSVLEAIAPQVEADLIDAGLKK